MLYKGQKIIVSSTSFRKRNTGIIEATTLLNDVDTEQYSFATIKLNSPNIKEQVMSVYADKELKQLLSDVLEPEYHPVFLISHSMQQERAQDRELHRFYNGDLICIQTNLDALKEALKDEDFQEHLHQWRITFDELREESQTRRELYTLGGACWELCKKSA
jgi:hypothetical protein